MRRPLLLASLCLVAVTGALLHFGLFDRVPEGQVSAAALAPGETVTLTGQVYEKDSQSIFLKSVNIISSAVASQQKIPCKDNFICLLEQAESVPLGSVVTVEGSFCPFSAATNPGEFDSAEYYRIQGIGGKVEEAVSVSVGEGRWRLREALYRLRRALILRLERVFPEREAGILCALLLGDKAGLDSEVKELYRRNGILHILSISSLHITLLGMSVYRLLRKCRVPACPAAIAGCVLLLLYGMLTGFGVSACRAIGMYLLRMLAEVIGRTYDMLTAMGVMAAVLTVKNPYYLRHAGFLLSFASIVGIGVVYPTLDRVFKGKDRRKLHISGKLWEAVLAGGSITLATLPVQLWFYYQVPVYSVALNVLVLPCMKLIMGVGLLTLLPGLGFLSIIDCLIFQWYEQLCRLFDRLPFHTWNPGKPRLWQVTVYYLLLFAVIWLGAYFERLKCRRRESMTPDGQTKGRWRKRPAERLCLGVALLLAVGVLGFGAPAENQVLFLDVGQGDCILVRTASGENYLFDCGSSSRSRVGKYVLLPCLRYYGIQKLDGIFLSHPDTDHINGALELLTMGEESGVGIKQLILPELSGEAYAALWEQLGQEVSRWGEMPSVPVSYLRAGESWQCGSAAFTCLHPGPNWADGDTNEYSLCIYAEFKGEKGFDLLLTGDVEGAGEAALLEELRSRKISGVTVLKVAHHGSRNSTSEEFLAQVQPQAAIISCGSNNRYGHPHRELLERLKTCGAVPLVTYETGAVILREDRGNVRVEMYCVE